MINTLKFDQEQIIVVGDIHGKFRTLDFEIHKRRKIQNSLIIQLGDFGVGFEKPGYYFAEFKRLNKHLEKNENNLIAIRGNHDDPNYFTNTDKITKNIDLVGDYTILETKIGNILCIGGAASVDKEYRKTHNKEWWEGELPVYNLDALKELENYNINYVVAHSNPKFCYPHLKSFEPEVNKYCDIERKILSNIYDYLDNFHTILGWYNGHYHWRFAENINETKFVTLDIMEFKEIGIYTEF